METDLARWALDEACLMTGRRFEKMLSEGENPFETQGSKFASAPKRLLKKMKIPQSGVW